MKLFLYIFLIVACLTPSSWANDAVRDRQILTLRYSPSSHVALSKMVWKYNYYNLNNDAVIDEFMGITNCPLYQDYFGNDFLWQRIREGVRRELKFYSSKFDDRFEIIGAIELGKYDFRKSAFDLLPPYQLSNAGMLRMAASENIARACGNAVPYDNFPVYYSLLADNPFNLVSVPVSPEQAKPLIDRLSKYNYKGTQASRLVILRVRVKLSDIINFKTNTTLSEMIFKGQLDEIAVFEDPKMTKLIWKKTFKDLEK